MRLLERGANGEVGLTRYIVGGTIPPYAILSHTWMADTSEEVTFEDFVNDTAKGKAGYDKIKFCAEQAEKDNLRYFWVDTCCIDKSNNNELSEAINSMFRWYQNADRCYVYLTDVSVSVVPLPPDGLAWEPAFRASKWFTRGWTLQELLAPSSVEFFTLESVRLGDKTSLEQQIHKITQIPIMALQGTPPSQFSVDERFSWANTRQTTRAEDWAYCLLGTFGVFIPLIYGEGRDHAIRRLRKEIEDIPRRQECLQKLYTCPYRDRKDRNPQRVEGTCEWFTSHSLFQNWQQSTAASLLWVSADPGCGKSVLARYLVDKVLPSTNTRTTCYFFFKDDFEDQKSAAGALCCILRQIFVQNPARFSHQLLRKFQTDGQKLLASFRNLWDMLVSAAASDEGGEIICILDALDECDDGRDQLIAAINKFYSATTGDTPALKFLLTSRPYLDIKRGFGRLERKLPLIHLSGENEEETGMIAREISIVIGRRVEELGSILDLREEEEDVLREELTRIPNSTYLWVHLIFDIMETIIFPTPGNIRSKVREIPRTVDKAYERILSKSVDYTLARKLLHIVTAATRPLSLKEMALALVIRPNHQSFGDLEPSLEPEERFRHSVRALCGLFVVVVDSKIYLLHQTAREFLVSPSLSLSLGAMSISSPANTALPWKHSLRPGESHRVLAEICMWRLSLTDFDLAGFQVDEKKHEPASNAQLQYLAVRTLLGYSAQNWAHHLRQGDVTDGDWAITKAEVFCRPDLPVNLAWREIHRKLATRYTPGSATTLVVASYLGLDRVLEVLPRDPLTSVFTDVHATDSPHGASAISWACAQGHQTVIQQLLSGGADVNTKDARGATPLHEAAMEGYGDLVKQLLEAGADPNAKGTDIWGWQTPLHRAAMSGQDDVVKHLLEAGADVSARTSYPFRSVIPLHYAAPKGHDAVVERLLKAGSDPNATGRSGHTPLHSTASNGYASTVRLLLAAGADPNIKQRGGDDMWEPPLHHAAKGGHDAVVELLLEAGADIHAKGYRGCTALHKAALHGFIAVAQRLIRAGIDVNTKDDTGDTPLQDAIRHKQDTFVQWILGAGADAGVMDVAG